MKTPPCFFHILTKTSTFLSPNKQNACPALHHEESVKRNVPRMLKECKVYTPQHSFVTLVSKTKGGLSH